MGKDLKKKRKKPTKLQKEANQRALEAAHEARRKVKTGYGMLDEGREERLEERVEEYRKERDEYKKKYWDERRKTIRLQKSRQQLKGRLKEVKAGECCAQRALEAKDMSLKNLQNDTSHLLHTLQEKIDNLNQARKRVVQDRTVFKKRWKRAEKAKESLRKHIRVISQRRPHLYRLMNKGVYTREARELARYLVRSGTAEKNVGQALQEIGKAFGVEVDRRMDRRTVQRAILEIGIAADIQLGYEMAQASKLVFSSDSTSHKHIEYEARTIALEVVDYTKPGSKPAWKMRSFGVGTSVNHTSETQINGLRRRLEEIADIFNSSPLAKREGLTFNPDDFMYRLVGTSGDHAADQKKGHELLRAWRRRVIFRRMGEEALLRMDIYRLLALLAPMKLKQIELHGGQAAWNSLTEDEKAEADVEIVEEVGKQVFENLPEDEQERMLRFIRTGCCMHKDLNCVKWGDRAMQGMWVEKGLTRPILLANRDNAAVLEKRVAGSEPSAAERRAEEVSKRGASHATTLGGMICRNKDKKKGQQDTYNYWMETNVGVHIPFPDVSNTRYGSHGEASATIIVYRPYFIEFMQSVRETKDKMGYTNIEKNFALSLEDKPTLVEMCTLALYSIAVSRPFMAMVRQKQNILDLEPFFKRKVDFLTKIEDKPTIWTTKGHPHSEVSLSGEEWDAWSLKVLDAVHALAKDLSNLDDAVKAFVRGARTAFIENFSDEFKPGGEISRMSPEERAKYFFASTNDINEGALGSWRLAQRRRAAETLHKFNSSFKASQNDTEDFIRAVLTEETDEVYLRKEARALDESGIAAELREEQTLANRKKAEENRRKENARVDRLKSKEDAITQTSKNLVLEAHLIDRLKADELNRQLDYHRNAEKQLMLPTVIPLKSHMKNNATRIMELQKAAARYLERGNSLHVPFPQPDTTNSTTTDTLQDELHYESDHNDDYV